jgi:hypothetical protein
MLTRKIRIYVIPAKPTARIADPRRKDHGPDVDALKRYAELLCRELLSRLSNHNSTRRRKAPSRREGGVS